MAAWNSNSIPHRYDGVYNNNGDEGAEFSSDISDSEEDIESWVSWYCGLKGNEFFCEVEEAFIQDNFNLSGLSSQVPFYDLALDIIQDLESPEEENLGVEQKDMVENAAEMLYGLIHARYLLTSRGMYAMREKFAAVDFGRCHRVYCEGQPVLPIGQSDVLRHTTVNIFCPKCKEIYFPKSSRHGNIDGAYFGTTFPHLFLMTFPQLAVDSVPNSHFVPKIYGFKIHSSSPYYNARKELRDRKDRKKRERGGNSGRRRKKSEESAIVGAGASSNDNNSKRSGSGIGSSTNMLGDLSIEKNNKYSGSGGANVDGQSNRGINNIHANSSGANGEGDGNGLGIEQKVSGATSSLRQDEVGAAIKK